MFEEGDLVHVVTGPFASFNGVVEEVDEARSRLMADLSVFGRATRVELEFGHVEKAGRRGAKRKLKPIFHQTTAQRAHVSPQNARTEVRPRPLAIRSCAKRALASHASISVCSLRISAAQRRGALIAPSAQRFEAHGRPGEDVAGMSAIGIEARLPDEARVLHLGPLAIFGAAVES